MSQPTRLANAPMTRITAAQVSRRLQRECFSGFSTTASAATLTGRAWPGPLPLASSESGDDRHQAPRGSSSRNAGVLLTADEGLIRREGFARAAEHLLFGVGRGIAGTVYGTVVVMATLTAAYAGEKDPWKLATTVAAAVLVLWVAHVYAHTLSETLFERPLRVGIVRSIARRELGIVLAAVLPFVALVLGAIGVFRESRAVWIALGVGLFTLGMEGVRYARLEGLGRFGTLAATGLNVALGLLVVALKVL